MPALDSQEITIAITVYDRRRYIVEAIRSALNQTTSSPPKVIVVEDCGPDAQLREFISEEFGKRIEYIRNPKRRGLCDNWNACIAVCQTPWLCILHDDDTLEPTFVSSMIELATAVPGRGLYYGLCNAIDEKGRRLNRPHSEEPFHWHELDLEDWTRHQPVCFPGQLFHVASAQSLGGFRSSSQYTADWEMWFRLALTYGAAATNRVVANYRDHATLGRGTTTADLAGRRYAYTNMQRKRHVAWLRKQRPQVRFDRRSLQAEAPMSIRYLLQYAGGFSPRMLRYHVGLLHLSKPPHLAYRVFKNVAPVMPSVGWATLSYLFGWIPTGSDSYQTYSGTTEGKPAKDPS